MIECGGFFLSGSEFSVVYICIILGGPGMKRGGLDLIYQFNPATLFCLSQARIWISNSICPCLFMFSVLRWELIFRCVDIVEIVDDRCLYFIFIIDLHIIYKKNPFSYLFQLNMTCLLNILLFNIHMQLP